MRLRIISVSIYLELISHRVPNTVKYLAVDSHTTSILRLSTDLPIVVEVADTQARIDAVKPKLDGIVTEGLITEERVKIILYSGNDKKSS